MFVFYLSCALFPQGPVFSPRYSLLQTASPDGARPPAYFIHPGATINSAYSFISCVGFLFLPYSLQATRSFVFGRASLSDPRVHSSFASATPSSVSRTLSPTPPYLPQLLSQSFLRTWPYWLWASSTVFAPPTMEHRLRSSDHRARSSVFAPPTTGQRLRSSDHREPSTLLRPPSSEHRLRSSDLRAPLSSVGDWSTRSYSSPLLVPIRTPSSIPRTPSSIPRTPSSIPRTPSSFPRTPSSFPRTPSSSVADRSQRPLHLSPRCLFIFPAELTHLTPGLTILPPSSNIYPPPPLHLPSRSITYDRRSFTR